MESYINENTILRKRLDDMDNKNKNLLTQLQKLQDNFNQVKREEEVEDVNPFDHHQTTTNSSSHSFATLLMVLVLFFAVLLGLYSPFITKDSGQLTTTSDDQTPTTSAETSSSSSTSSSSTIDSTKTIKIKVEAVSPSAIGNNIFDCQPETTTATIRNLSLSKSKRLEKLVKVDNQLINDNELISSLDINDYHTNCHSSSSQFNNNNNATRSKCGNPVEITKVKPFVRKATNSDENQSVIIVNLPTTNGSQTQIPTVNNNQSNYRVINTTMIGGFNDQLQQQQQQQLNSAKLPTRFRLINSNGSPTKANNSLGNTTSIIKLTTTTTTTAASSAATTASA
jgi:hypothetical protein